MTLEKTPQGPEKSITLTPSEIKIATEMRPLAGGVSLYFAAANPFTSDVFESLAPRRARSEGKVVRAVPIVAAAVRNLRLFMVLFLVDGIFGDMFDLVYD